LLLFSCHNPFWPDVSSEQSHESEWDIKIGENGNWWINGNDTGVSAGGRQMPGLATYIDVFYDGNPNPISNTTIIEVSVGNMEAASWWKRVSPSCSSRIACL